MLRDLYSSSQIFFSSVWLSLLLKLSMSCFMVFIMFFSSIISVQYFKNIVYIALLNSSFCSHIIFLSSLTCLSVFSWPLSFLKIIVWILFSGNSQVSISLRSVTGKLLFSIRGVMVLLFHASHGFAFIRVNLRERLPLSAFYELTLMGKDFPWSWIQKHRLGGVQCLLCLGCHRGRVSWVSPSAEIIFC